MVTVQDNLYTLGEPHYLDGLTIDYVVVLADSANLICLYLQMGST